MAIYPKSRPFLICAIIYLAYFIPFITLFITRRKKEPIHSRGWELALVSALNGFFQFMVICFETVVSQDPSLQVSCHFLYWPIITWVPVFLLPYFLRSVILYTKYRFNLSKMQDKPEEKWLVRNRFVSNPRFTLGIMLVSTIITVIIGAAQQFYVGAFFPPNSKNFCLDQTIYLLVLQVAFMILLFIIAVIKTWGINDAFEIKTELKVLIVIITLLFIPTMIRTASSILTPYTDQSYFTLPIIAICFTASIVYPVILSFKLEKARFDKMSRVSAEDLASTINNIELLFKFVMENDVMRREFQKFCVDAWCVENFLFYRDVHEYREIETKAEMVEEARKIADLYIGQDAPRQINIDMQAEQAITSKMQVGDIDRDLFRPALAQVETQMKQDTLSHWKQTTSFRACLDELRKIVEKSMKPVKFSMDID